MDDTWKWAIGCVGSIFIAALGAGVSLVIAVRQTSEGRQQAQRAIDSATSIATDQGKLTVQLDTIEEWRRSPQLVILRSVAVRRQQVDSVRKDEVNCTIQNFGGRDLVLFEFNLVAITRATEMKGSSVTPLSDAVIKADRSKVETIDLSAHDVNVERSFTIDPAIVVKPGESLTLKFIFPYGSRGFKLMVDTNVQDTTPLVDPFGGNGKTIELIHFEPSS
jgi:hypothetical protein